MKIVFFGSDDFAIVHLDALIKAKQQVLACVTSLDKPKGRGMKVTSSPVKVLAQREGVNILQPQKLDDPVFMGRLKDLKSDMFVVIAYGKILPKGILAMPKYFAINVHSSLLPKYRGPAPINWAIIHGEKETGISIIKMNEKMDAGDILVQEKMAILSEDTSISVRHKMMEAGPKLLLKTLTDIGRTPESCPAIPQEEGAATYAPKLTKELGRIDWCQKATHIHNLVRGLLPWPTVYTFYGPKQLKLLVAQVVSHESRTHQPGTVIDVNKRGFAVATGQGSLLVKEVHLEAAKPMGAYPFLIGHKIDVGFRFPA